MSDIIVDEIRNKIRDLESYRYTQKIIVNPYWFDDIENHVPSDQKLDKKIFKKYRELTGLSIHNIEMTNPILIRIIEELGMKAWPYYIETVSMLPCQKWFLKNDPDRGVIIGLEWDF